MNQPKPRARVGNEFSSTGPKVLDLRGAAGRPVPPKRPLGGGIGAGFSASLSANLKPDFKPAAEVLRRATTPPVHITFNPVHITKTEVAKKSFLDGFAYDLLFIALAFFVSLATPFRDWLFLGYLLMALVFRVSSQRIFRSALFCLVAIPLLTQLKRLDAADSFAVFTFYFLSIGVLRAIIELRHDD